MAQSKLITALVAGGLVAGLGGMVFAQSTAEALVKQRRDEMSIVGRASGGIRTVANAATVAPETLTLAKGEADKLVVSFNKLKDPALWAAGSGVADGVMGTKAKAEIWTNNAAFMAEMDKAVAAAAAVKTAVDSGDQAQMKAAQAALQGTCGSCHSKFRT